MLYLIPIPPFIILADCRATVKVNTKRWSLASQTTTSAGVEAAQGIKEENEMFKPHSVFRKEFSEGNRKIIVDTAEIEDGVYETMEMTPSQCPA